MSAGDRWGELIDGERVMELHLEGIKRYGGDSTATAAARSCVDSALANAWQGALYSEPEEATRGLSFAAFAVVYLAKNHCFVDGNKRVAWLALQEILANRRLTLAATEDEAEAFVLGIIAGDLNQESVADWITLRLEWIH